MRIRALALFTAVLMNVVPSVAQWLVVPSGLTDSLTGAVHDHGRFLVASGGGSVLSSTDGGLSFGTLGTYTPNDFAGGFDHIAFFDSLNGVATTTLVGDMLHRTADGGATWTPWTYGPGANPWVQPLGEQAALAFLAGPGLTFGTDGRFLIEQDFALYADIDSICNEIYALGSCMEFIDGADTIISTGSWAWTRSSSDRCASFDTAAFFYGFYPYSCDHVGGDTVVYLDFDLVVQATYDAGVHWQAPKPAPEFPATYIYRGFDMLTSMRGTLVGPEGSVWNTNDGGGTWTSSTSGASVWLRDVRFLDALHLYAVGDGGTILRSMDGGETWDAEESGVTADLKSIAHDGGTLIVVGDEGVILRKDLNTGREEGAKVSAVISAYPNPLENQLDVVVDLAGERLARVDLFDLAGRVVRSVVPSGARFRWDLSDLPGGHYVLAAYGEQGRTARMRVSRR